MCIGADLFVFAPPECGGKDSSYTRSILLSRHSLGRPSQCWTCGESDEIPKAWLRPWWGRTWQILPMKGTRGWFSLRRHAQGHSSSAFLKAETHQSCDFRRENMGIDVACKVLRTLKAMIFWSHKGTKWKTKKVRFAMSRNIKTFYNNNYLKKWSIATLISP